MLVIVAALLVIVPARGGYELVLEDGDSGAVYAAYPVELGERFSVTFIHSVNQSPLTDVYEVREDGIYLVETRYYSFGAGVQTEVEEGQTLAYAEDGAMVVSGFEQRLPSLSYIVGTVSDHILEIGGREISLRALCGRNGSVRFLCG